MRFRLSMHTAVTLVGIAHVTTSVSLVGAKARLTGQDRLANELSTGHAVLLDLDFAAGSHRLEPSARPTVARLARAINATSGAYIIGAYVDDSGNAERDVALSGKRAVEVKALLVLEGVPPKRVVAAGYGAVAPRARAVGSTDRRSRARIEVLKVQ
jgi:outer membrane protein OmpA-like peptidoglycan-associated protein